MHFPCQNHQNVKCLPEIIIFQEPLITETQNLWHWIWHASNPKYAPLKSFQCIFLSQNQSTKCEILAVSLTPPDKKLKNVNLHREKVFEKACKSAHIGFGYADYNALC